jgi:hypothetical protein
MDCRIATSTLKRFDYVADTEIPAEWGDYPCSDYFSSLWSVGGYYEVESQIDLIVPLEEIVELAGFEFLSIGRPGVDGIEFGYRKGQPGLWAFYPIGSEFKWMAPGVRELVDGWCEGRLFV